jgi:hypothetical protein
VLVPLNQYQPVSAILLPCFPNRRAASFDLWAHIPLLVGRETQVAARVLEAAGLGANGGVAVQPPPVLSGDERDDQRLRYVSSHGSHVARHSLRVRDN